MGKTNRQYLKLVALFSVFAAPLAVAWGMVEWRIGIPDSRTAHGTLEPGIPQLRDWPLVEEPRGLESDDWILAFDCTEGCEAIADRWWRVHRALGREAPRVARLRVGGELSPLPGEYVVNWRSEDVPAWQQPGHVWLLDPQGRVLLAYASTTDPADVLDDINHVLRRNPDSP